ncbi:ABC transporter permease subunit [Anaeropeptidivorans aminofermentans]|jgi:simple sugar transport system permease protein|uniref:ABC transporter permease subunit n=1 Tax=Anaeropeptidivorans aminofermentans TaxID=2934315 RepID=UPI002025938C|nr:ABC transporter permease [Anaeropeptidivorans aminofermentans]MBE6013269.1 ABC transporter permease [Lachnospiraceae bacterium]
MNKDKTKLIKTINSFIIPVMFLIIIIIAIPLSGFSIPYLTEQMVTRLARNAFLVISLLLPIMAGMGINFGMTLGAMAGQIGLIFVTDWGVTGIPGLLLAMLLSTPIAMLLGEFAGRVLNRVKGKEMITSMMLSFFISGVYLAFTLYICGYIIPFKNPALILSRGYGVRNALNLDVAGGFDNFFDNILGQKIAIGGVHIPIMTFLIIVLVCIFTQWFKRTKLGQDMRAVGQDMKVADSAGINVEKVRIQSIVISTVLAAYGQIIYLQNIGTLNTYNGADQAALFAAAALLIGGATVSKASIINALVGTILFHLMFIVMPVAGKNVTGQAMIGEYFRTFVSYAIVTLTLVIHSWKRAREKELDRQSLRLESKDKPPAKTS